MRESSRGRAVISKADSIQNGKLLGNPDGCLPAVLLVLGFQKYLVQGLTAGSVKG